MGLGMFFMSNEFGIIAEFGLGGAIYNGFGGSKTFFFYNSCF